RFPWVCAVRRVTKDGRLARLHLRRPKVLRLDQLASHLPNGMTTIPNNLIPIVLDESYAQGNAIAPLRMNIVLEENVTPAQREKAREILASRGADFLDVD
ncbi:MAG: hypothetical protein KF819_40740, partial [Labilithrix sp.]|nr:hypothetical protein [Labilithrix sp.]